MKKIFKTLKTKDVFFILLCAGLIVFQVWLDMKLPKYMMEISTLLGSADVAVATIWEKGGYMLLCALGSMSSAITVGFFTAKIAAGFSMRLRKNMR